MKDKIYSVIIPIKRRDFEKTSSAKFKGDLIIVSNDHGIIYDWNIDFKEVWIDLYSTKSWITNKTPNFKCREKLFKELNFEQCIRPDHTSNKIVKLSEEQLKILNDFFNDRKKYKSTIKNIVAILKGNNPGGEAKNPNSAEMIIDNNQTDIKNFVILIDDLCRKFNSNFKQYFIGSENIDLNQFCNLNKDIKAAFDYMQAKKDPNDFYIYLENIKKYYSKYNTDFSRAEYIVKNEYANYIKNIKEYYDDLPFNYHISDNDEYQKCHIYERWIIRDEIYKCLSKINTNLNKIDKLKSMISDYENFIPLPESIHRQFDRGTFTYNELGIIKPLNNYGEKFISKIEDRFKKIDIKFMTAKRIEYFKLRKISYDK